MRNHFMAVVLGLVISVVNVNAQSGGTVRLTNFYNNGYLGGVQLVVNRVVVSGNLSAGPYATKEGFTASTVYPPVPGVSPIMGLYGSFVMLENGDVYVCEYDASGYHWRYLNNGLVNIVGVSPGMQQGSGVSMALSPNPSQGDAVLDVFVPVDSDVVLEVVDVAGRQVAVEQRVRLSAGQHAGVDVLPRNSQRLAPGSYFVRASVNGQVLSARAVIVR